MKYILLFLVSFKAQAGFNLTVPEPVSTKQINSMVITKINIDFENNNIAVYYNELDSSFNVIGSKGLSLSGTDYNDSVIVNPDGAQTLKHNLRLNLLNKIKAKRGLAGSVN